MTESYCGKNCEACTLREALACPGCKDGPGHKYQGDCELAKCIQGKGHENCLTCRFCDGCGTRKHRDTMAQDRLEARQARERQIQAISAKAPFLITWLNRMFVLLLVGLAGNVLALFDALETVGQGVSLVADAGVIVCLLALRKEQARYCSAAVAGCIAWGLSALVLLSGLLSWPAGASTAFSWMAAIARMVGLYMEFTAHSQVLAGADDELAAKWNKLWAMYIGMYAALFACLLVVMLWASLGLLLMLAISIAICVLGILRLVYLRQTVTVFGLYR